MLEQFFTYFKFAFRQRAAFLAALDTIKQLLTFKVPFTKITASVLAVMELFTAAFFDTPRTPRGPQLDLSGYELVFCDEFDGDSLDTDVWTPFVTGGSYKESPEQIQLKDGNMVVTTEYRTDGPMGEGWYTGDMALKEQYCKGYFEIRCKVFNNKSRGDFWSAFWLTCDGVYDAEVSKGGPGGCEIDIFESFADVPGGHDYPRGITPAVWCNGVDDNASSIDGINFGQWFSNDPVNEFNTYGVLWTDEYYIWYINGVECFRTSYGNGVSEVPEILRVSMCSPHRLPEALERGVDEPGAYVIDDVKIYQPAQ